MFKIVEGLIKDSEKCRYISQLDYELIINYCNVNSIEIDDDRNETIKNINNFLLKNKEIIC